MANVGTQSEISTASVVLVTAVTSARRTLTTALTTRARTGERVTTERIVILVLASQVGGLINCVFLAI